MNRQEAADVLRLRNTRWPNTPVVDVGSEVEVWANELAPFPMALVEQILANHDGGFALTIGEVRAQAKARTPRPAVRTIDSGDRECPTCGRSPFGPHRNADPCRTCGRDDAPIFARYQPKENANA